MLIAFVAYLIKDIFKGKSLGKLLFGLQVRQYKNLQQTPPFYKLIYRNIFIMFGNKEKRRLGDKLANTQVVGYRVNIVKRFIIVGVLAFVLFVLSVIVGATQVIRNDNSYKTAIVYIENQSEIQDVTGEIKGYGNFPMGSVNIIDGYGEAELNIKVKGKKMICMYKF
ncbi:MAG: hypothetical protein ACLFMO_07280 [Eubacteriales bacterium]